MLHGQQPEVKGKMVTRRVSLGESFMEVYERGLYCATLGQPFSWLLRSAQLYGSRAVSSSTVYQGWVSTSCTNSYQILVAIRPEGPWVCIRHHPELAKAVIGQVGLHLTSVLLQEVHQSLDLGLWEWMWSSVQTTAWVQAASSMLWKCHGHGSGGLHGDSGTHSGGSSEKAASVEGITGLQVGNLRSYINGLWVSNL